MDRFDDKLKQKFHDATVADESWLEPSNDAFAQIEKAIAEPTEDKSKKLLFLLLGALLVSIAIIIYLLSHRANSTALSQIDVNKNTTNTELSHVDTQNINESVSEPDNLSSETARTTIIKKEALADNSNSASELKNIQLSNTITEVSSAYSPSKSKLATNGTATERLGLITKPLTASFSSNSIVQNDIQQASNHITGHNKQKFSTSNTSLSNSTLKPRFLNLNIPTIPRIQGLNGASTHKTYDPKQASITILPVTQTRFYFDFAASAVFWQDQLNANYDGALDPADFTQNSDFGYSLDFSFHKKISKPIALGFGVNYFDIGVKSGHNTILSYDASTELNGAQNFQDLRLATPYGFVQSDIVIERSSTNTDQTQSLNASVNSIHNIKIVKFYPSLDLHLFDRQRFNLIVNMNVGLNFILSLQNEIDYLDTGHTDYTLQTGTIISDQTHLNYNFWSAGLGLKSQYNFNARVSMGARLSFNEGLTPLFNMNDFSSRSRSFQMGLNTMLIF